MIALQDAPLAGLHEDAVPATVSWMPQTVGWAVVGVLLVVALLLLARALVRQHRAHAYRREALAQLGRIEGGLADPSRRAAALTEIPVLVKRTALGAGPRNQVAALTGTAWLTFLDRTMGSTEFTQGPGRLLPSLAYEPSGEGPPAGDVQALTRLVRRWIRKHRVRV